MYKKKHRQSKENACKKKKKKTKEKFNQTFTRTKLLISKSHFPARGANHVNKGVKVPCDRPSQCEVLSTPVVLGVAVVTGIAGGGLVAFARRIYASSPVSVVADGTTSMTVYWRTPFLTRGTIMSRERAHDGMGAESLSRPSAFIYIED